MQSSPIQSHPVVNAVAVKPNDEDEYKSELEEGQVSSDSSDSSDSEFNDGYDENLMGDEEDQARLQALSEKERETEIFKRSERRDALRRRWEIEQKLRQVKRAERAKDKSKAPKDKKKKEEKRKRKEQEKAAAAAAAAAAGKCIFVPYAFHHYDGLTVCCYKQLYWSQRTQNMVSTDQFNRNQNIISWSSQIHIIYSFTDSFSLCFK